LLPAQQPVAAQPVATLPPTTAPLAVASPAPSCQLAMTANVNVRAGPDTSYNIIGPASAGTALSVTGRSADHAWWRVMYGSQIGWVSGILASVTASGDCGSVPVVSG
jgi:uncharacterized protein YraI